MQLLATSQAVESQVPVAVIDADEQLLSPHMSTASISSRDDDLHSQTESEVPSAEVFPNDDWALGELDDGDFPPMMDPEQLYSAHPIPKCKPYLVLAVGKTFTRRNDPTDALFSSTVP